MELGALDFAARRHKIQQAFTKSIKETEMHEEEEKRRKSSLNEGQSPGPEEQEITISGDGEEHPAAGLQQASRESPPESEEVYETPGEDLDDSERELKINTGHLSERSVLDFGQEDSPTLGESYGAKYDRFARHKSMDDGATTPSTDAEPDSAITAGTSDSVGTFFDDEPQEPSPGPYSEQQALLSQIIDMRDTDPDSPIDNRQSTAVEEPQIDADDQESIQIGLGETPVMETAQTHQLGDHASPEETAEAGPASRWSMSSWTSSSRSRDGQDTPMERIEEHSPEPIDRQHLSVSTAASDQTPQPWSPATFASPRTERTTMDSDAYSTINRVLDQYHDPSMVNPELLHDMQQQIFTQSPDLARQGGWDPKKVTALYLKHLASRRQAHTQSTTNPDAMSFPEPKEHVGDVHIAEDQGADKAEEKILSVREEGLHVNPHHEDHDHHRSGSLEVDEGQFNKQRASLNHPDDWNMSPSIADWIAPQAADSPAEDKLKDWRALRPELEEMDGYDEKDRPRQSNERPQLPEIGGLGLTFRVDSPRDENPPPLPNHTPPPPPVASSSKVTAPQPLAKRSQPSPSVYSKHASSTSVKRWEGARAGDVAYPAPIHQVVSGDSSYDDLPPRSGSSSTQEQSSMDAPSEPTTTKTPSPIPEDQKKLATRKLVIKEIVDTEHTFGQDMKIIEDIYKGTYNVVTESEKEHKILFGNSDKVVAFTTTFLDALKQAAKPVYVLPKSKRWRNNRNSNATSTSGNTDDQSSLNGLDLSDEEKDRRTSIGEIFNRHMNELEKVFGDYIKNVAAANALLANLVKNQKASIWLKECEAYASDLTQAWNLDSLLVKPVQRLLKYPLLLRELIKVTPENHPDFAALDAAVKESVAVSQRVNEPNDRKTIVEKAMNPRKRKESDLRMGVTKILGRRKEKLRQQTPSSDVVNDDAYDRLRDSFNEHYIRAQVVKMDVEHYLVSIQEFMAQFGEVALAIEGHMDVSQTSYPEIESKWRKFRMSTREMADTALSDHVSQLRLVDKTF